VRPIGGIHGKRMADAPDSPIAGEVRKSQNRTGGNDYNPCSADFVPPTPSTSIPCFKTF
jgi:hypothetical protein